MKDYQEYFKGKKITMLGLGLLGRGLNDAKFFAENGAILTITDLKTKEELAPTLKKLAKYKHITYVLGEHRLQDFRHADFVLKAAGVPLDSPYIAEANKHGVPVEMDESLFAKLARDITIVGITGTRGKTTTTYLIYEILRAVYGSRVHLGGNIRGLATLPLLNTVKEGDIVVLELSSWQLQGWGDGRMSPQISVFTNFLDDHLNYYLKGAKHEKEAVQKYFNDKAKIFTHQKTGDALIVTPALKRIIKQRYTKKISSALIVANKKSVASWKTILRGEHNQENIAQAVEVARLFGIPLARIKKIACAFKGVEGRQEFLREYRGVKIYNDTTATTPDATIAALRAFADKKQIILIAGGANKNLDTTGLVKAIRKYAKHTILLAGTGTDTIIGTVDAPVAHTLKEALHIALSGAKRGDIVLLSPAFASFGMFKNEFDRGDQFTKLVKNLR